MQVNKDTFHVFLIYGASFAGKKEHPLHSAAISGLEEAIFGDAKLRTKATRIPGPAQLRVNLETWFKKFSEVDALIIVF